ncbi:MAG: chemotaxis protein CheA [Armatimonadetes bacterium]|nr:chemotaxis protein CheA [Armatimonadota bacterium]
MATDNSLDMSQYLDLFLQEAEEQLEILEQETLKLEADPSQERLQIIFRSAHTLKGSSRAMGFNNMAELTHEMENVLDQLRNDQLQLTTEIADALLSCLDNLVKMADMIRAGQGDSVECPELVKTLQGFVGSEPAPEPKTKSRAKSKAAKPAKDEFQSKVPAESLEALHEAAKQAVVYHGKFRLAKDCIMKYVRAFMVSSILSEEGEILVCVPEREALEEESFELEFELLFQTKATIPSLESKINGVSELDWFELVQFAGGGEDNLSERSDEGAATANTEITNSTATPAAQAPKQVVSGDAGQKTPAKAESGQTVRVDVTRLDTLMNLVGELVIDRTRIAQIGADLSARFEDPNIDALAETVGHIARITSDLQDQIMKARMMPIETVFNRFPRVVRDLAQKLGKDVKFEMEGGDTELDRSVIEVISDPLLHILRNSLDHGLETPEERRKAGKTDQGTVTISAKHQENHIVIEIVDDGRGIDAARIRAKAIEKGVTTADQAERMTEREILQFIFASGFSTATEVSDVSGRGVGMDIVRSNLQKLGGIVDLETDLGKGTRFSLRLPLTLAIIRGLLVKVAEVVYVIPLGSVIETLLIEKSSIKSVKQNEVIVIRGMTTPLVRVRNVFTTRSSQKEQTDDDIYVVIVGLAEQRVGLVVDRLVGEQEVVIKSLNRYCGDVKGVSGATILGDGNVALIMDVNSLVA